MIEKLQMWLIGGLGFISAFGLVVLVHELGHFLAAKLFKVPVDRFVIGFDKEADHKVEIEHARRMGIPWPVVLGSDRINSALLVGAFPTNYFLDLDGKIVLREVGFDGPEKLAATIGKLLAKK